ncbi:MAG: hypothetical protein JWM11_6937 [Planctomycetaceae bacterium]|nr:hypothetical protein [Planctomycetaceae bacterium]
MHEVTELLKSWYLFHRSGQIDSQAGAGWFFYAYADESDSLVRIGVQCHWADETGQLQTSIIWSEQSGTDV